MTNSVQLSCTGKLTNGAALDPAGLVAIAVAHSLALFVGVSMAANVSGGHLNPAVTLGLAVGGYITILTGIFYWVAQLLGSVAACFLLKFVTGGLVIFLLQSARRDENNSSSRVYKPCVVVFHGRRFPRTAWPPV